MKQDPLEGLHDIHLPTAISWWPPAPGWWGLLVLVLLLTAFSGWMLYQSYHSEAARLQRRRRQMFAAAGGELDQIAQHQDSQQSIVAISILLRRVAVQLDPQAAGLAGNAWLKWLDEKWERDDFSAGYGRILIDAPYRRAEGMESAKVVALCRQWLDAQQ